ncbi:hypothetical protein [Rathayibacter sp. VKM Ac-2805]|uniref:hypothetical protein n=1 Tax=Rathayibacter sp. VKM Ac-2805 TaxID=2609258 RepID=UPI001320076F|nr:hypothetical protein [Rathayibacter sp. VKM Ac-2805]QHC73801.1 hypothetical protein GSU40_08995 [Rathayibacter sp. VKM Ac-2805]
MDWWQDVLNRTSWLELIASFVSIVLSVLVALWIQRRDFSKRTEEAVAVERARVADVATEERRALIIRAYDLIAEATAAGLNSAASRSDKEILLLRTMTTASLFELHNGRAASPFASQFTEDITILLNQPGSSFVAPVLVSFLQSWGREEASLEEYVSWSRSKS